MTEAQMPSWPVPAFGSREAAIAAAMSQLEPGDSITVHQQGCALGLGTADCDCTPQVLLIPEAVA